METVRTDRSDGAALDCDATLFSVARLAVPFLADWCALDVVEASGAARRAVVVHADPAKAELAERLCGSFGPAAGAAGVAGAGDSGVYTAPLSSPLDVLAVDEEQRAILRQLGCESAMVIPVVVGRQVVGTFTLGSATPNRFAADELRLAEDLVRRAATILESADHAQQLRRRLTELTTVQHVARAINSRLRLDELFRTVVTEISSAFGYDLVSIYLREGDGLRLQAYIGYDDVVEFIRLDEGMSGRVARSGRAEFLRDAAVDPEFIVVAPGTNQAIICPLKLGDGTILGTLAVESAGQPGLTDDDFSLLLLLADQVSVAVANARLFDQLQASEQRFRTIFERAPVGLAIGSREVRIRAVNAAFQRMLGYTEEELLATDLWSYTHPDDAQVQRLLVEDVLARRRDHYDIEKRFIRRDGSIVWANVSVTAVREPGSPEFYIGIAEDITPRKEAERQQQWLARSEKLRALGQMASGVAHDLNQYLGLVAGHGELLLAMLDQPEPPRQGLRRSVETVVRAAFDGAETVRRLQTFARPRQDQPPETIALGGLLHDVAQLTAPRWRDAAQAAGRPISLEVEVTGDTTIKGSPASLREALTNLVLNAVDALPSGGSIRLNARREGERVVAEVRDSGIGMPEDVQARVFEPFFTTKGEHGSGLGLALVFAIVEQHGGTITLESAPGLGTTFQIVLPAAPPEPAPTRPAGPAVHRALRVLVVDDEPELGAVVRDALGIDSHTVEVVTSAEAALECLEREPFDVLLSDVGLGAGMNGWELAERVRADHPDLPIVLATGWGAALDHAAIDQLGVRAVLAKPFRLRELRNAVNRLA